MQQCGVHVVHRDAMLDGVVAEFVGCSEAEAGFDATAGEPHREGGPMMVAAVSLGHRRASEFRAEDDERVVQHAALFQVGHEGGGAAIDLGGGSFNVLFHAGVMVPVAVINLDETDPRSASRRANRHFDANEPSFPQVP